MLQRIRLVHAAAVICALVLAGCGTINTVATDDDAAAGNGDGASAVAAIKLTQITDIPIPREARVDETASLILGSGDRWLGRVVIRVKTNSTETYNYYFSGMPRLGWTTLAAVQSKVSTLTFTSGDRVANLQIEGGVGGATVTVVVSTRQLEQR
jgi:predicted small secreted protein